MKIYLVADEEYEIEIVDSTKVFLNENAAKIYAARQNDKNCGNFVVEEFEASDDEIENDSDVTVNYKYRVSAYINHNKDGTFKVLASSVIPDYTLTLEKPGSIINERFSDLWKVSMFVIRDRPFEDSEKELFENIIRESAADYIKRRLQK